MEANRDFRWYFDKVHTAITKSKHTCTFTEADEYADRGVKFLQSLLDPNTKIDPNSITDNASCILWALIRFAYQNDYIFGKGMFNIIFSENHEINNKIVKRLSNILYQNGYSRLSSHYPDATITGFSSTTLKLSEVKGIDIDRGTIPFPAEFETVLFAQIKLSDINNSLNALAFKPETQSVDLRRPIHASYHYSNWNQSRRNITPRTPGETEAYREKKNKVNRLYEPNPAVRGTELICCVTKDGLKQLEKHKLILKNGVKRDDLNAV